MRELQSHRVNPANDKLRILVMDGPGSGGANHEYRILKPHHKEGCEDVVAVDISFQNGPIAEVGVNGVTHEALLAILIDRLMSFQMSPYACQENDMALQRLLDAQHWLKYRTLLRMHRGVEGTRTL